MWELGNLWAEGNKATVPMASSSSSYLSIMYEIQVLLVDHESDSLLNTTKMLEMCQYRVTLVELASAAIKMLLSGKAKFDLVIANINSPDLHGFKLLQQAVNMGIPIILMSSDDNTFVAMRAIESGAALYIQKPVTMEIIKCIWQHVLKEKNRAIKEREKVFAASYSTRTGIEFREVMQEGNQENPNIDIIGGNNIMLMSDDNGKSKRKSRGQENEGYDSDMPNNKVRRKVCTEWTQELHEKFMAAVEQLGEGRCFPKEILELMDVPGLTRMQVASHLQKCRNDNWRSPDERKSNNQSLHQSAASDASDGPKPRRFGSMPRSSLGKADLGHQVQVQGNNIGGSGSIQSQTANNANGNMGSGNDNITSSHQHYENLMPHGGGMNSTANPRHQSADDFFNFAEMDCLIQNFHGLPPPQGTSASMMEGNPNYAGGFHHFDPAIYQEQKSHWNTDQASTFGGDGSETGGHN